MRPLSHEELIDWLRLARGHNLGSRRALELVRRCGSPRDALDFIAANARASGLGIQPASVRRVEAELEAVARSGIRLIALPDPAYPPLLAAISDPPLMLSVAGDPALLHRRTVALVGARNASAGGQRLVESLARGCGEAGLVVVSGLARGIDAAAHEGALATGTIAVLAGGVDTVYPPEHHALQERVTAHGALVSEMGLGVAPKARHFPRRNRVIAGLSLGVVVVEAARRSGSLITARLAAEEGREIMAVPGSPLDPRSHGGNQLIRDGAVLIESTDDVLRHLPNMPADVPRPVAGYVRSAHDAAFPAWKNASPPSIDTSPEAVPAAPDTPTAPDIDPAARVTSTLGPAPVTVDELVRRCQLSASTVASVLMDLELEGRIERHPGQRVSLR